MIQWMTLEELARYLKVSRATLYKRAQAGELPAVKIGRHWRFDPGEVNQWLKASPPAQKTTYPWQDCLDHFVKRLREEFPERFVGVWLYGSWARGEATQDSDVDLMVVLKTIDDFSSDFKKAGDLAYASTYDRNRAVLMTPMIIDEKTFLIGRKPLLLNIRAEGKKAA